MSQLLVLVLSNLQLILFALLNFPSILSGQTCCFRDNLIIRSEYFQNRKIFSSKNICKTVFLLDRQERKDAINGWEILFVMIVSNCHLTNNILLLRLWLHYFFLHFFLNFYRRSLFLLNFFFLFYYSLLLRFHLHWLLFFLLNFWSMANSRLRLNLCLWFLIDWLALNQEGTDYFRVFFWGIRRGNLFPSDRQVHHSINKMDNN